MKLVNSTLYIFIFVLLHIFITSVSFSQKTEYTDWRGRKVYPVIDRKKKSVQEIGNFRENIKNFGFSTTNIDKDSMDRIAKELVDKYSELLKISSTDLIVGKIGKGRHGWNAIYIQSVNGIPVEDSRIVILTAQQGEIVNFGFNIFPEAKNISTIPIVGWDKAVVTASNHFHERSIFPEKPKLVILPIENDTSYSYHLAWKMNLHGNSTTMKYYVSAIDGKVIQSNIEQVQ